MLQVNNITKNFEKLRVLNGINLTVTPGEIVSIVGPSGAGKTTLLQIMGTLDKPDTGFIDYSGVKPLDLSPAKLAQFRNRHIGFIFQFHNLLPEFTLQENVALPALIAGDSRKTAFAKANELIKHLGLTNREHHQPAQLSGGERQRAAVARALIMKPDVVLADEPTGSLDSHNRAELHRLFFDLRKDFGHTFVIVTHDENLAADTDRRIMMADGQIVDIQFNIAT